MKTVCSRPRIRKIVQALSESRDRRLHHLQWATPTERRVKGGAGDTLHFACLNSSAENSAITVHDPKLSTVRDGSTSYIAGPGPKRRRQKWTRTSWTATRKSSSNSV